MTNLPKDFTDWLNWFEGVLEIKLWLRTQKRARLPRGLELGDAGKPV